MTSVMTLVPLQPFLVTSIAKILVCEYFNPFPLCQSFTAQTRPFNNPETEDV